MDENMRVYIFRVFSSEDCIIVFGNTYKEAIKN